MSSRLKRAQKGEKSPSVRRDEFSGIMGRVNQELQQINAVLAETTYIARSAYSELLHFSKFLASKGIIVEQEYKDFVAEQNRKSKRASEIMQDEKLSIEEKKAQAKAEGIPDEWMTFPEQKEPQAEVVASEEEKEETAAPASPSE